MRGRSRVLVTGATGTTARALVPELLRHGVAVTAASRHPSAAVGAEAVELDWYAPETHDSALRDAHSVYLVPPPLDPDPASVMVPFLQRARLQGMRRAVLLSASVIPAGGPASGKVHEALADIFEEWTVLRPSWFMQNFTGDHFHAVGLRETGRIVTATGTGRVGFIDAADIASVAARALTGEALADRELLLTGPEALSYGDVAEIYGDVTGRQTVHEAVDQGSVEQRLSGVMAPEAAGMLARLDTLVGSGAEDRVTDTVERITGRSPLDLRTVLERELARQ